MIKGLAITPPVIGRIAIGHVVEKNGKRLPEKDDFFTITTQIQTWEGWMLHPLQTQLVKEAPNGKLRAIPVRFLFNAPDLNLRAQYCLFDRNTGRPICVGDGATARRRSPEGFHELLCPSPEGCEFGRTGGCKLFGRLNVQIEGQDDELGTFAFRTTGYNSVRTLSARLTYFHAASGGLTKHLPLMLRLRAKSTTMSYRTPVYYADLTLRDGQSLVEVVSAARQASELYAENGVDSERLEDAARLALANGSFEESEDEMPGLIEEFYPEAETQETDDQQSQPARTQIRRSVLAQRLSKSNTGA